MEKNASKIEQAVFPMTSAPPLHCCALVRSTPSIVLHCPLLVACIWHQARRKSEPPSYSNITKRKVLDSTEGFLYEGK